MADIDISSLPIAIALDGTEYIPLVQGGTTKRATSLLIASLAPGQMPVGGTTGQALVKASNANYATTWHTISGLGTVTEIDTGAGLTGGPITISGTVALASVANGTVLANVSGISAAPSANTPSAVLDVIGSTRGSVLYRGAAGWAALGPGTVNYALTSGGAGADPVWAASGTGTVTSVGLSLPAIITVSGSPVTNTGTLTGTLATQTANYVWAGPTTGAAATPAFRALVGADLPNPGASSKGGVQSLASVASNWINTISTSGVPSATQPAFTDISGTLALPQLGTQTANTFLSGPSSAGPSNPTFRAIVGADLPNPSSTTLGGVQSLAAVASKWINQISTSGVPTAAQPSFTDIAGGISLSQLPIASNNTIISNISGGSAAAAPNTLTAILDSALSSTQGVVIYRGASAWSALGVGTNGQVLTTGGAAANPAWTTVTGTGTVTNIATNNGVTGGAITTTGTIGLANIANNTVLANVSGGSLYPSSTTPTLILDVIGATEGDILYRGVSTWAALAPGTSGQVLQTQGAGSTPQWANAGSVSSVSTSGALIGGPITTSGTISLNATIVPQGRLTLTTATPVMSATASAATTIYYTPYLGNLCPIYDGTNMVPTAFAEVSVATTDTTKNPAAIGASKVNDWFVWSDSGTIRIGHGPDWTNDTTRSAGTALVRVNGVLLNNASITNGPAASRGTYVGTTRSDSSSKLNYIFGGKTAGGTAAVLNVWNTYNRVITDTVVSDSTSSWTYNSATWAPANSSGTGSGLNNRVSFVRGLDEDGIDALYQVSMSGGASGDSQIGIGLDITNGTSAQVNPYFSLGTSIGAAPSVYSGLPGIGAHFLQAVEHQQTTASVASFFGAFGGVQAAGLRVIMKN